MSEASKQALKLEYGTHVPLCKSTDWDNSGYIPNPLSTIPSRNVLLLPQLSSQ